MPPSRKITTKLLAAATLLAAAAACSAKDAPTGPRPTGPSGRLRVVHRRGVLLGAAVRGP